MKTFWKKIGPYLVSIVIALAVGGISALFTNAEAKSYESLVQPPLSPPPAVFPIVWSILFVLLGISAAIVWKSKMPERSDALFVYGIQLVVNFLWTIFYFNFGARLLAFFWLLFLLALVLLMIKLFYAVSKTAARLQIPYALWIVFAGYLNLATYLLNR